MMERESPAHTDPSEFALRVAARPNPGSWSLLAVPLSEVQEIAKELAREVEALEGSIPALVAGPTDGLDLATRVARFRSGTIIVSEVDRFTHVDWEDVDWARSRLMHDGEVVLVLSLETAANLLRHAPHLASWLGSYVWTTSASELRREHDLRKAERLTDLRAWAKGMTDDEVLRLAAEGRLPAQPEFSEWLVLLGRGDLVAK